MNKTKIEWVKNPDGTQGFTWNPITGCLNGCEYCYARKLAYGRLRARYLANTNFVREVYQDEESLYVKGDHDPFYPRFWPERVKEMFLYLGFCKLKGIFVCDMSDLFGIGIPQEWTREVLEAIKLNFRHRFYLLTKQPQNLIKFKFPDNCWVGVTATDTGMAYKAINNLKQIEARIKYISFEPLLGKIINWVGDAEYLFKDLDWVIIGTQTKPYKPPKIEWVEEIVRACDKAGIPVFLKENLRSMFAKENNVNPNMVGLRQELPIGGQG